MRSIGSIIFWIILLVWIVMNRRVNSRRNDDGNGTNMDRTPRIDNRSMQNNQTNRQQPYNKQQGQQPYYNPQQQKSQQQKSQQQRPQAAAKADAEDTEPEAGSTMAYLEEKARQDAMEHAREKREEARRLNITYGGLRAAERCYEGDSVPSGKKCIVCSYCGANNLIPQAARERYSCYFCREAL